MIAALTMALSAGVAAAAPPDNRPPDNRPPASGGNGGGGNGGGGGGSNCEIGVVLDNDVICIIG